jgi:hypothetical protein
LNTRSSRLASRSNSTFIAMSRFSWVSTETTSRTSVKSATALTGRLSDQILPFSAGRNERLLWVCSLCEKSARLRSRPIPPWVDLLLVRTAPWVDGRIAPFRDHRLLTIPESIRWQRGLDGIEHSLPSTIHR